MPIKTIDGLPVIDATEPLVLKVTTRDIKGANPKQPDQCAIARACKRQLHVHEARIHLSRVYLRTNNENWVRYLTPKSARAEIIAFDRGGAFEPGEFKFDKISLREVTPSQKLGKRRNPKRSSKAGKPRKAPHVVTSVRASPT